MATPGEKLAQSLEVLRKIQTKSKIIAITTDDISRTHLERLTKSGFLKSVTKGWYISTDPKERVGDTTSWYVSYWQFSSAYLKAKYKTKYCLSAEQSLLLHAGNTTVPQQMIIRSPKAPNDTIQLLHGTSLYILKSALPTKVERTKYQGLQVMTREAALVYSSPKLFIQNPIEARTVLASIVDSSDVLKLLLEGSHTVIAGRLAGAFRNIGRDRIADDIIKTMRSLGYDTREKDPFIEAKDHDLLRLKDESPYLNRLRLMWESMRKVIIAHFPKAPGLPEEKDTYLSAIEEIYITDAYHSLSIERYEVSVALIEKVRSGQWDINDEADQQQRDAMAARGYYQATAAVTDSIRRVLEAENSGHIFDHSHGDWYRALFAPSVLAGILSPADLAGYRTNQVYISNSMHVPPSKEVVRALMPAFIELLKNETEVSVRVVLGHFMFVYIHPYMDGNGRMARFLMNMMLASGGYPWTVIPVDDRDKYMNALEQASAFGNIEPFTKYLAHLVHQSMIGEPVAKKMD